MSAVDKTWSVYRHTSPSGKVYIGITTNLKDRWASNGRNYCTYNSIFKKAIDKYGWDNIKHEIILEDLNNLFINEFPSITAAMISLGKTSKSIENCLNGRAKTAFGYKWEYKSI